jgi:hypothetical protein
LPFMMQKQVNWYLNQREIEQLFSISHSKTMKHLSLQE